MADAAVSMVLSGLVLGSLYALMASGLSVTWSTLRIFNFAHGAFMTLTAYVAWTVLVALKWPLLVGVFCALLLVAVASLIFGIVFVTPFLSRPQGDLLVMVTTLAAMTMIVSITQLAWGPQIKQLPSLIPFTLRIGEYTVGSNQLVAIVAAPSAIGLLTVLINRTRLGLAIRAVEQNREAARRVGIRPDRIYAITLVLSALLAGIAGILLGGITFVTPTLGDDPLLKAFVVVIFGGLARLSGSVAGAYVFGVMEAAGTYFFGLFWTPVLIFSAMIIVMLVRPEGLLTLRRAT